MGNGRYSRIFVSLKDAMLALRYKELVHFLSKLSTPYFEGVDIFTKDGWNEVVSCIEKNHAKYDLKKEIKYKELRENIADIVEKNYNRKKYAYEEFEQNDRFLINKDLAVTDLNQAKTRLYYNKFGNLVYIKTIVGIKQELLTIKISTEIDNSIFEIPTNYAENSYNQK